MTVHPPTVAIADDAADTAVAQALAEEVGRAMWSRDNATQALGMALTRIAPGAATITMPVRPDMAYFITAVWGRPVISTLPRPLWLVPRSTSLSWMLETYSRI